MAPQSRLTECDLTQTNDQGKKHNVWEHYITKVKGYTLHESKDIPKLMIKGKNIMFENGSEIDSKFVFKTSTIWSN